MEGICGLSFLKVKMMNQKTLCLLAFVLLLTFQAEASICDIPMPRALSNCFSERRKIENLNSQPGLGIYLNCVNRYIWSTVENHYPNNTITQEQLNWIWSLDREYRASQYYFVNQPIRIRREIRTLSETDRVEFLNAINALKQDTTVKPNMYDIFAILHKGIVIPSAHYGSNFLGWHRVLLYYLELALRRKYPRVTIPYWDSTKDFDMDDPTKSVIFSSKFFGNGQGCVVTGPFKNWITPDGDVLRRYVGCPGAPISKTREDYILRNSTVLRHSQVTESFLVLLRDSIEGMHNGVHAWIKGQMNGLETSPQDPVFFLHHSFIDYLWARFREKQMSFGIRSDLDYPSIGGVYHQADRPMDRFPWVKNKEGYSNIFSMYHVRYEDSPECPFCGWSPYFKCSNTLGRCVPKSCDEDSKLLPQQPYHGSQRNIIRSEIPTDIPTFHNTFAIDGEKNVNKWVFMPVLITYRSGRRLSSSVRQAGFPKCPRYDGINILKVFVRSDGFSYRGTYFSESVITETDHYNSFYSVTAVKNPNYGPSIAFIAAFDVYGRICKAMCLVPNSYPVRYRMCSGTVKTSNQLPCSYAKSYDEAIHMISKMKLQQTITPGIQNQNVFLKFVCDNDNLWAWTA